jgi:hypothetical protein
MKVIFGTPNRVSQRSSNNPKVVLDEAGREVRAKPEFL